MADKYNFFSNNLVYLDGQICEIMKHLKYSHVDKQRIYQAPEHTHLTPNLLVFLNGVLQIEGVDYEDYNSNQINFLRDTYSYQDIVILLIRSGGISNGNNNCECDGNGFLWEDFINAEPQNEYIDWGNF